MTKEDIIRMAREACLAQVNTENDLAAFVFRFAALVAAAERKQCVRVLLDGNYWNGAPREFYECAQNRAAAIRARSNK